VLKPLAAHHWRQGRNWAIVGERKAIAIESRQELEFEYEAIAHADKRALLQELVPGDDDCLLVMACYIDRNFRLGGAFMIQKLAQEPVGFGTGCVLQTVHRPELAAPTLRLLAQMKFNGIAEVEYKWDRAAGSYKLIEVNPRPWDQHRLGRACGVDVIYLAYCDHAGLPVPACEASATTWKWIADDSFFMAVLRSLWRRDGRYRTLLRLAGGKRIYGIWSLRDPVPFLAHMAGSLIPLLAGAAIKRFFSLFGSRRLPVISKGDSAV